MTVCARVVVVRSMTGPRVAQRYQALGVRALCPTYMREVRHARRVETREYPMFSRYMFAWAEDDELRRLLSVRDTVDVLRCAGDARRLASVPEKVIAALSPPSFSSFNIGDRLRVAHGRWEGFVGLCSRTEKERVFLLFQMLGTEVEMPFHRSELGRTDESVGV